MVVTGEREKGEKMRKKIQSFTRRPKGFRQSEFVEPRIKVHILNEGHAYIRKRRDFTKDPKEKILGNQEFRAREASYPCYYASSGRVLPTLVYFYLKGANLNGFGLKGLFGTDLRDCLALFPAFVPYFQLLCPILWLNWGLFWDPFYGWFVGCFMAQLRTVLGPFLWLFYGSIRDCFGTLFMVVLWLVCGLFYSSIWD